MDNEIGHINITITETDIAYDSEFTIPDVIFWLNVTMFKILNRITNPEVNNDPTTATS